MVWLSKSYPGVNDINIIMKYEWPIAFHDVMRESLIAYLVKQHIKRVTIVNRDA